MEAAAAIARVRRRAGDEQLAIVALAVAMTVAGGLTLQLSRGTTFTVDEISWYATSPGLTLRNAFDPYLGHLVLVSRLEMRLVLDAFGPSALALRLIGLATTLLTVGLVFAYTRRRVGAVAALAPCLVLLVFGADRIHALTGNAFSDLFSVACGLAALMLVARDRTRDLAAACVLLCLGILSWSAALAFLVGCVVAIGGRSDWRRRSWVVAIPIVLYAAWWLWSRGLAGGSDSRIVASNIFLLGSWGFQALGATTAALTGLGQQINGPGTVGPSGAGPALAVLVLLAVGISLRRRPLARSAYPPLAVLLSLWTFYALGANHLNRAPDSPRYLFPSAVALLLVGAELARRVRWTRGPLIALFAVAATGVGANYILLRQEGAFLRDVATPKVKTILGGVEAAGPNATPAGLALASATVLSELIPGTTGARPAATLYLDAADTYGGLGSAPAEVEASPFAPAGDLALVTTLGLRLTPAPAPAPSLCRVVPAPAGNAVFRLPPGGAVLESRTGATSVELRRFASTFGAPVGAMPPGKPMALRTPRDNIPAPWYVSIPGGPVHVCAER